MMATEQISPDQRSTRPRIAQNGRLMPALEADLAARYDVLPLWQSADPVAALQGVGAGVLALVTSAPVGASASLIAALPNLQLVASFGVGTEQIDLAALQQRGVPATYTPEVLDNCVADTAFGLLISVARGMPAADRFVRRGDWPQGRFGLATRVSGKRLGILGLGRIGQAIARRSSGFDMAVRYTNRQPRSDVPWRFEPSLLALADWADFLVVAAAGGPSSQGLVNAAVLKALGSSGFLINVARGSLVDEAALVQALQQGHIAGAGLDVFAHEPHVPPALLVLDNVVLLPHVASATHETRQAMADLVLANLQAHFEGRPLPTPIPGLG